MKRVLVISYYWPPSGGSGVQRWVKMCKYLPELGWQPIVYTPSNPALTAIDKTLGADVPKQVEVIRRPIIEPGHLVTKATSAQVTPINAQKKSLKQKLAMWIRGNLFIPDPRVLWVRPSAGFLIKYLKTHPVDAIVSTGPPQSMHLIARAVARKIGVPWVADFRDPWTRMFYFKHLNLTVLARRIHERMEKSVLDEASCIVAVSPLVRKDFESMTSTRVELITNGYDPDDFKTQVQVSEKFTLLHAGLLAADGNPVNLWKVLGELVRDHRDFASQFKLILCGKTDQAILDSISEAGLASYTENLGYLCHTDVVEQMGKASILLLPLRQEPEYKATLPGKLFEYLAARRPIVGIGQKDGAMAEILLTTGSGKTFDWDETETLKGELLAEFRTFAYDGPKICAADIDCYSRPALAARYAALLDELCLK